MTPRSQPNSEMIGGKNSENAVRALTPIAMVTKVTPTISTAVEEGKTHQVSLGWRSRRCGNGRGAPIMHDPTWRSNYVNWFVACDHPFGRSIRPPAARVWPNAGKQANMSLSRVAFQEGFIMGAFVADGYVPARSEQMNSRFALGECADRDDRVSEGVQAILSRRIRSKRDDAAQHRSGR